MPCARCDADNPTGARFCSACGASLEHACAHCGASLLDGQRFCNACGHDLGASAAPAIDEGERRNATVMFSDLTGYTALNEASDPEDVEAIMGRIKAEATIVIERHGGTVNQFVGDEIMALFGVPLAHRDDPRRAVAAAIELHDAVRRLVAGVEAPPARELRMHTGINTGLVVARRSDARAGDYALTGDAVNIAARLRSLAEPGEVLVSAETWQQVSDHFEAETGAPVEVKGKERPLSPYRIRGARAAPAPGGGSLVGRDEELRDFAALGAACVERKRSRVVVVRGDPGVGKSRLVAEFATAAQALGFSCHCAAVLDFGAQTGRDAVRSLARSLLGVATTAEETERRAAIESAGAARPDAADRRLFLYDLLDVTPPPELRALAAAMSTAAREQGSLQAVCDLAASVGTAAPLLLVVEDIHWADAWTLERLAALALLAAKQPLLLVMTTRFAGDPTAAAWRTVLHGAPLIGIDLAPLGADDASRLATQAAASLPPALIASCVERAEGNPLFLLQLLLNAGETAQSSLPGSIQALVHARMDRLAGEDKVALQAAAILGQRYTAEALRHLLDNPGYDGRLLVENFLVRADGSEFMFCHALIRDGAYESLLHKRRRLLHARAAEWFEPRDLVLAAEHFDRAEDPRAAEVYLAAGNSVAAQFRHAAALALIERGLRLAAAHEVRFALLMARGRLMVELGRSGDAIEACRAALEVAAGPGERAQALIATAAGMRLNDRIAEGLAALDEAEPLAVAASLPLELSRLHHLRGNLLFPLGRHAECLHEHELARQHAREGGSLEAEAAALGGLGDAFYLQGRMRSAHQQFLECVALARKHGFGRLEIANLPMVGWSGMHLLEIDAVVVVARQAIELAQRASQPRAELMARVLLAWSDGLIRDRRDEAEQQAQAAFRLVRALGAKRFEGQLHAMSASIALRQGDRQRALQLAEEALAVCREHGMGHIGPWVHGVRALVETDSRARLRFLEEGETQLALGCVSHNHIHLRELAVDVCLEVGAWNEVEQNCQLILDYTAQEPLPLAAFIVARGRALARFGRGERSAALRTDLTDLADLAGHAELNFARIAVDEALVAFGEAGEAAVTATNG